MDQKNVEYIYKIMEKINSTHDLNVVAKDVVQMMIDALDCIGGALFIVEEGADVMRPFEYSQIGTFVQKVIPLLSKPFQDYLIDLKSPQNFIARTVTEKHTFVGDQFEDFISPILPRLTAKAVQRAVGMKTIVTAPTTIGGKVVGVLLVGFREKQLTEETQSLIKLFSSQCAIAVNNAQKYEKLQNQYKKVEEVLAQQSDFIAVTAHEFRTPLTIALFQVENMMKMLETAQVKQKDLEVIQSSLSNLKSLTQKLFDVQKYDLKKVKVKRQKTDMKAFIYDIYMDFLGLMQEKQIDFKLEDTLKADTFLNIDPSQLRQVLHNLLTNAYKFTPPKNSIILKAQGDSKQVIIKVIDHGKGIPDSMKKAIFNKFRTNSKGAGIGLGLYICKKIVELHQGKLWAEDTPKKGATFCLQLGQ